MLWMRAAKRRRDHGASVLEYAVVLSLVAALAAALLHRDFLQDLGRGISEHLAASTERALAGTDGDAGTESADGDGTGASTDEAPPNSTGGTGDGAEPVTGATGGGGGSWDDDAEDTSPSPRTTGGGGSWGDDDDGGFWGQVGGFFSGAGNAIWEDVQGLGDIFTTNPVDTVSDMVDGVREDPWSLFLGQDTRQAWSDGDYGEAIGRGAWEIGSWFIPGAGWAAKGGKLGRIGSRGGNNGNSGNDGASGGNRDRNGTSVSCPRGNSFLPGTLVLMADGSLTPIESVETGDEVFAADPETGQEGPRPVTALIEGSGPKTLIDVTVADPSGAEDTLTATDGHPFWLPERDEWVLAADLAPGTWLRTSAGTWVQVTAVETWQASHQRVHNLSVEEPHTYHVAVAGTDVLVHNDAGCVNVGPDGVQDLRDHWAASGQTVANRRTVAVAEVEVDGTVSQRHGVSGRDDASPDGTVREPSDPQFTPSDASGQTYRPRDAEYKILEDIAQDLTPSSSGRVEIYVDRQPCTACQDVFQQFNDAYPDVDLVVRGPDG